LHASLGSATKLSYTEIPTGPMTQCSTSHYVEEMPIVESQGVIQGYIKTTREPGTWLLNSRNRLKGRTQSILDDS
jgi:hypothetical protein